MATNGIHQQILPTSNNRRTNRAKVGVTDYVSPSRLKLWLRCPLAYQRRYIDGIVTPTTPNLFLGQTVHRGLEFYHRYRQDGVRLYPEYVGEHIRKTWGHAVDEECITFESADDEHQLQAQAVDLVTTYLAQVPEDEPPPIAVEERFETPLIDPDTGEDLGIPLLGIVDLVSDDRDGAVIVDFKTSARSSSQLDVMHELQLSCYSYLFRQVTGMNETGLEIRSLIKTKTPKISMGRRQPFKAAYGSRHLN